MLKLRAERQRRGWTQAKVAYHARLHPAELSRIETGRLRPYSRQATRIARVLGLKPSELLDEV